MENTKNGNIGSTKNPVKAIMHNNPAKNHTSNQLPREGFPEEDSKDGTSLASCGREFQSLGAATEKVLSCVSTKHGCESGGTKRKALMIILIPRQAHNGRYSL